MRAVRLLVPVVVLATLSACGGDDDGGADTTAPAGGAALEGTSWVLDLSDLGVEGPAQGTLRLEDGLAFGSTGCNTFRGGYELDGNDLSFTELATTEMACEDDRMAAERTVLDALAGTTGYRIDGETLVLVADGEDTLTFEAASGSALVGTWTITGYLAAGGDAFTGTTEPATVTFGDDGTLSGNAGCNQITGGYQAAPGTLTVSEVGTTRMLCEEPIMDQEAAVVAGLQAAVTWQPTATGIDLFNADGTRVLNLAAG